MQNPEALACLQEQFKTKLQFMDGDCVLLLDVGAVDSDQLSLVERMTS